MARIELMGETATAKGGRWYCADKDTQRLLNAYRPEGGPSPAYADPDNELVDIAAEALGAKVLEYDPSGPPEEDPGAPS